MIVIVRTVVVLAFVLAFVLACIQLGSRGTTTKQSKKLTRSTIGRMITRDALGTFASVSDDLAFFGIKGVNRCTACTWPFGAYI